MPRVEELDDVREGRDGKLLQASGQFQASKENWLSLLASYPNLSASDLAVAIVIAKHLNSRTGYAWPSINKIAELINRQPSTVWRALEKLEQFELLHIDRSRGRSRVNRYQPRLGRMECEPKTLRRRKAKSTNWKSKVYKLETLTSEEE